MLLDKIRIFGSGGSKEISGRQLDLGADAAAADDHGRQLLR